MGKSFIQNLREVFHGCAKVKKTSKYIPLISRVFGSYCKLRILVFFHRSLIYCTDRKNEANKMFIIWLLQVSGTGNRCRTRDLTII